MTIKSWKKIYYPKPASARMSKVDTIKHSLKKWTGLLLDVLDEHNIRTDWGNLYDKSTGEFFSVDSDTCALCVKYYSYDNSDDDDEFTGPCAKCPLYETLGKRCDRGEDSVFRAWVKRHDPIPMIAALKKTLERVEGEE